MSVVNVLTKDAQDIDGLDAWISAGSFNTYNSSFLFGKVLNKLEFQVFGDYYTTQGADLFVEQDQMSLYDASTANMGISSISLAPGTYQEDRQRVDLSWKATFADFTIHGRFRDRQRGPFLGGYYALNERSSEDTRHFYTELEYRRYLTERLEFSGKVYVDDYSIEMLQQAADGIVLSPEYAPQDLLTFPEGLMFEYCGDSNRMGIEGIINFRLFPNNDLTLGATYEYFTVTDVSLRTNEVNVYLPAPPDQLQDVRLALSGDSNRILPACCGSVCARYLADTART